MHGRLVGVFRQLGYALHGQGRHAEAIEWVDRSLAFEGLRPGDIAEWRAFRERVAEALRAEDGDEAAPAGD